MTHTRSQPQGTAARRLVETLVVNGIDTVFCVPGESYLAVLDALADVKDQIRVVTCRHEAGAANMAEAYGKLTGKPGVCMVTRGPGATHASIGVHTAHQDSTPMILFVGHHDFTTFRDVNCQSKSPEKTLDVAGVTRTGEEVHLTFAARSFLHRQVRSMTGTLAEVGAGRWTVEDVRAALDARDRAACGPVAPACGLYLIGVGY